VRPSTRGTACLAKTSANWPKAPSKFPLVRPVATLESGAVSRPREAGYYSCLGKLHPKLGDRPLSPICREPTCPTHNRGGHPAYGIQPRFYSILVGPTAEFLVAFYGGAHRARKRNPVPDTPPGQTFIPPNPKCPLPAGMSPVGESSPQPPDMDS